MLTLKLFQLMNRRALVTRESAHMLEGALKDMPADRDALSVALDFQGVDAITPSFVDEALSIIMSRARPNESVRLTFLNPPTRLSTKFAAIARARDLEMTSDGNDAWIFARVRTSAA